jgi:hypothetical protein
MAVAKAKTATANPKTAAKPTVPVAAAKPAVAAPVKAPVAAAKSGGKHTVTAEVRARMIAEAAYYLAEQRGFSHGHHDADWAKAEKQIDALLARGV